MVTTVVLKLKDEKLKLIAGWYHVRKVLFILDPRDPGLDAKPHCTVLPVVERINDQYYF